MSRTPPATRDRAPRHPADREQADGPAVVAREAAAMRGGRTVWSGVTTTISAGEFVAILGPNGVGKSTLLQAILGLLPLTGGSIEVLGAAPGRRNAHVGYLPQRRAFDASTRIRGIDVVRLGWDGDRWGLPLAVGGRRARLARQRVHDVIDMVGAAAFAYRPIGECSGGEQQRLLIAQALVSGPRLLALDEPLDSLDVTNQASVSALIQSVCRELGVTVLMVAHDVNPILPYIDTVLYLAHGGAVTGSPADVITAETLTMLYGTPIDVLKDRAGRLVVVGQPDAPTSHHGTH
jgi:zinc/manganese transport system ATP-binding protein